MPSKSRRFLLPFILTLGLLAQSTSSACAHPVGQSVPYTVTAEDEWGNTLRAFHKGGETFILGTYGRRYNLRVRNQTGRRVEAVVTVDGRDVISGRVGDFVSERGYLIDPYGSVLVEGFRTSLSEVAAFRFSSKGESYSARMGTPQNVGVIGVAFFPERHVPPPVVHRPRPVAPAKPVYPYNPYSGGYGGGHGLSRDESPRESRADSSGRGVGTRGDSAAPSAEASAPAARKSSGASRAYEGEADMSASYDDGSSGGVAANQYRSKGNLGTEYGEAHESHVQEVSFRRESSRHPSQVVVLRYDDEEGLLARGIQLRPPPVVSSYHPPSPNPFPYNRFAPPPP